MILERLGGSLSIKCNSINLNEIDSGLTVTLEFPSINNPNYSNLINFDDRKSFEKDVINSVEKRKRKIKNRKSQNQTESHKSYVTFMNREDLD